MRNFIVGGLALAALGMTGVANAAPLTVDTGVRNIVTGLDVEKVQFGGGAIGPQRGWRGGGPRVYNRGGFRGRPYYRNRGVGLGIGGLAAGAIIGGAIAGAARNNYYYEGGAPDDTIAYCINRFKSYDPASGTYLGYDGLRHPCP